MVIGTGREKSTLRSNRSIVLNSELATKVRQKNLRHVNGTQSQEDLSISPPKQTHSMSPSRLRQAEGIARKISIVKNNYDSSLRSPAGQY